METSLTNLLISWLEEQNTLGNLIIRPFYQRKPVWSLRHKVYFIDTILRKLPIPKLYLYQQSIQSKRGIKTKYSVVDGQQRIRTILEYLDGKFEYSRRYHPKPDEFIDFYEDKTFQDLPSSIQQDFLRYPLPVEMITKATKDKIQNMYIRLNLSTVKLTPQEIRNAMFTGDFKKLAYSLAEDKFWLENKIVSQIDIRRMRDAEYVSEILMAMLWGPHDKKKKLNDCYAACENMDPDQLQSLRRDFIYTSSKIIEILPDLKTTRFKNKGDFYSLFYILYNFKKLGYKYPKDLTSINKTLIEIHKSVSLGLESPNPAMVKYFEVCVNSPDSFRNRVYRNSLLEKLLKPLFLETDERRLFTEEQKQFIWHNSRDKVCVICGKTIDKYEDYESDHKIPWSKGGPTSITNAQLVHKECNRRKGIDL